MLKNYLKTSLRNIIRYKGYSFINIFGLTVGLTSCIFIFLWVADELSYDRFHKNSDRAFRVLRNITFSDGKIFTRLSQPEPLAGVLREEVPEIEHTLRLSLNQRLLVRSGEKAFYENGFYGDSTIFKIFTFPIVQGDALNPLPDIKSVAISQRLAKKFFGNEDPVGQTLRVDQQYDFKISSVFADVPRNSELQFDYILPFEVWRKANSWSEKWANTGMQMMVSLKPGADQTVVNKKIEGIIKAHCDNCPSTAFLFPHTKVRLYSKFEDGKSVGGKIDYVVSFGMVAIVILLIACINFMNLATARAATRSREVGVRKVIGAQRTGLIIQFMGESLLLSFMALVLALGLVQLLLPYFNEMTDKSTGLHLTDPKLLIGFSVITLVTGLIAGSYPAFFLSSFKPASILKRDSSMFHGGNLRKTLVVIQFVAAVVLIVGSMVVYNQVTFIKNTRLGFDKENIIMLDRFEGVAKNQETFKNELLQHPSIKKIGVAGHSPFNVQHNTNGFSWPGKPDGADISFKLLTCDQDFIPTLNINILEGRNFTNLNSQDTANFIINEQAMEVMGFTTQNVIGSNLEMDDKKGKIIGLVGDFNNVNLRESIAPLIFEYAPQNTWRIFVKVEGDLQDAIAYIRKTQAKYDPEYPFEYSILNDEFNKEYRTEEIVGKLSLSFTIIAILISCLGLFGLASFTAARRTKELGIRKVMGASVVNLIIMLCSDFTRLVAIGLIIGCPVAWYLAAEYLSGYAFHAELNVWIFVVTMVSVMSIAIVTVVYQSIRAAMTNPVNSLRNE